MYIVGGRTSDTDDIIDRMAHRDRRARAFIEYSIAERDIWDDMLDLLNDPVNEEIVLEFFARDDGRYDGAVREAYEE